MRKVAKDATGEEISDETATEAADNFIRFGKLILEIQKDRKSK
jgi:hypothetical protein